MVFDPLIDGFCVHHSCCIYLPSSSAHLFTHSHTSLFVALFLDYGKKTRKEKENGNENENERKKLDIAAPVHAICAMTC